MEFQVAALGPCRKKVSVTVPPERIREEYDRQYDEINKNLVLPGFRKGRAPRRVLEKRFGPHLGQEVKEGLLRAAMEKLVEEKRLDPLAPPEIDLQAIPLDPAAALTFEFEMLTKPEFATPAYQGLTVKVPASEAKEEEVQAWVDGLRRRRAKLETVEGATLGRGDVAVVDWQARSGDSVEARDEGVYYPLGRGVLAGFVPAGLDAALEGKAPGATFEAPVQVAADDPREELRGRELTLAVVLREVKRYALPPVDAEFLKAHDYDDEAEMREDVRKRILRAKRREIEREAEERLVEQLLGSVEMSLPPEFVEREMETWAQRRRVGAQVEGVAEEEVAKQIDAARGDARRHIEHDMRRFFLLERIAEAEGVEATQEEMVQAIEEIATAYGQPVEEVLGSFRDRGRLSELRAQIRHRKVRERIRQAATLVEEAPPAPPAAPEPAPEGKTKPTKGGRTK